MSERCIIIDLGLPPDEPMWSWDRKKASVTDADTGKTVGYIDLNDGMRITVILDAGGDK